MSGMKGNSGGGGGVLDDSFSREFPSMMQLPADGDTTIVGLTAGGGGMHGKRALEGTFLGGCVYSGRMAARAILSGRGVR